MNQSLNFVHQIGPHNQSTKILMVFCLCFTHYLSFCDCSVSGYSKLNLFTVSNRSLKLKLYEVTLEGFYVFPQVGADASTNQALIGTLVMFVW